MVDRWHTCYVLQLLYIHCRQHCRKHTIYMQLLYRYSGSGSTLTHVTDIYLPGQWDALCSIPVLWPAVNWQTYIVTVPVFCGNYCKHHHYLRAEKLHCAIDYGRPRPLGCAAENRKRERESEVMRISVMRFQHSVQCKRPELCSQCLQGSSSKAGRKSSVLLINERV